MSGLINTIKKFISNKNTVTIIGVLAGVIVLWGFYTKRVNDATTPIKVPYAKEAISARTEITEANIGYIEINSKFLKNTDIYTSSNDIIGKYVNTGTSIPEGGLFYKKQVVEKSALPSSMYADIPKGTTPYGLSVNNHSTFGNSIYPGDKIDLFLKATDDTGKIIFGKFIEAIDVLAVTDSSGNSVFDSAGTRAPAELIFAVPDDMYVLLKSCDYISGVSVVPVPRNRHYTTEGGEVQTQQFLKDFILAKTAVIPTE